MKAALLGLVLAMAGCGIQVDEIRPEYAGLMPAAATLELETDALMQADVITTSKGDRVVRRVVGPGAVVYFCGTDGAMLTRACTVVQTFRPAGSLEPLEQYWIIYVPSGFSRELMRHELRHVYAGSYHE